MKPSIIVITGPTELGKGELVNQLIRENPQFVSAVAYTDRPKREGEVEGKEFHFVNDEEFTNMIDSGQFVEWQRLISNTYRYGKTKAEFSATLENNPDKIVLTRMNIINLPVFKRLYPEVKSIFIDVIDTQHLIDSLKESTELLGEDDFDRRFKFATEERRRRHLADVTIKIKDTLQESIAELLATINKLSE
jgi:guanylate kinase